MAQPPKPTSEQRLKSFFRETLKGEPGVSQDMADQLADRCVRSIDRVLRARVAGSEVGRPAPGGPPPFNPFAFSVVAILAKAGREALLARLAEIPNADSLKELAAAQHIAIDPVLNRPEDLRIAIVKGAERRIAARRAAAS